MKKITKKQMIARLEKQCISLWHDIVLNRDKECVLCGSKHGLQCHHVFTKGSSYALRFTPDNGVVLCSGCHQFRVHIKASPELGVYLITKHGKEWFDQLRSCSKVTIHDKLMFLEDEKQFLLNLKEEPKN